MSESLAAKAPALGINSSTLQFRERTQANVMVWEWFEDRQYEQLASIIAKGLSPACKFNHGIHRHDVRTLIGRTSPRHRKKS